MQTLSTQAWQAVRQRRGRALANERVQAEASEAAALLVTFPELTRDQALREAARIVARRAW